jgi:hypothetical protein
MEQPEQHTLVDEATFMNALPENVKELFTTQVAEQPESSKPEDAENEEETEDNLSPLKPPSEESPHQESPTTTKSPSLKPQTPQYEILSAEPLFVVTDDPKTSIHAIEESGAKEITSEILDDGNNNEEDQDEDEEEVKTDSVLEAMKKSKEAQSQPKNKRRPSLNKFGTPRKRWTKIKHGGYHHYTNYLLHPLVLIHHHHHNLLHPPQSYPWQSS